MKTTTTILGRRAALALLATLALAACGGTPGGLQAKLRAQLAAGELGEPPCAPVTGNLRPVERGFADIAFDALPGAYRVVVLPSSSGWRMASGVPELLVFTRAGFYAMRETRFMGSDGIERPAREFRLTPKGYEAMAGSRTNCFPYRSFGSLEILEARKIAVPGRLSGMGRAYRVKYRPVASAPAEWARTPEFRYVFNRILTVDRDARWQRPREQTLFVRDGRWISEREAMSALWLDALGLHDPRARAQTARARARIASQSAERKAARVAALTPGALRAKLAEARYRRQLAPCLELPLYQADLTRGFWKQDAPPSFVFYDDPARRTTARHAAGLEIARRLEQAGLAKAEPFDGEPFAGARKGRGTRYLLSAPAAAALERTRPACLPLGGWKLASLRIAGPNRQGVAFRAWARLDAPRGWTAALAARFPNVRAILEQGYGIAGVVPWADDAAVQARVQAPRFGLNAAPRPFPLSPPIAKSGPAVVDLLPAGAVRMQSRGCAISEDGTEVSAGKTSCGGARASRGFRAGRAYAEITFRGRQKGAHPDTWTNAAVTSQRFMSSVSTGAALFSFAGSFNKQRLSDGDVIGIALDMDAQILYWHLNGKWMTGRPGSGIGEPMIDANHAYFIAVSVQDKAESWRVDFGAAPFRFPRPAGFPAYGAPRTDGDATLLERSRRRALPQDAADASRAQVQ